MTVQDVLSFVSSRCGWGDTRCRVYACATLLASRGDENLEKKIKNDDDE